MPATGSSARPAPLPTGSDEGSLTPLDWAVVVLVSLANLVPIWGFRYFPGQDTPNHLYGVEVLRALLDGSAPPALQHAFSPTLHWKSNMSFHAILLVLSHMGISLLVSHKILLSIYAIAFPLSGLCCAGSAAPRNRPLALMFLPLVWNWFVLQGLYNYVLSLVPALIWLGVIARDDERQRLGGRLVLALSAVAVYLSHVGTFVALLFVTATRILFPGDGRDRKMSERIVSSGPQLLALVPSLLLAATSTLTTFGASTLPEATLSHWETYDLPNAVGAFFVEFAMRYHVWELLLLGPPLVVLIWFPLRVMVKGVLAQRRSRNAADPASFPSLATAPRWPLRAAFALGTLYLIVPHIASGSDVAPRLRPIIIFCLLCYAGVTLSRRARRWLTTIALVSGLAGATSLCFSFHKLNRELDDFTSGIPYVRDGSRLYPMVFDPRSPSVLVRPFLHAWGYYGIARHVVTPYAFAWHESRFPYRYAELPLHTTSSAFPSDSEDEPYALTEGRLCNAARRLAPSLSCDEVRGQTERRLADLGRFYDYVLTWAAPKDFTMLLAVRGYRPVHEQGQMRLYAAPASSEVGRP